VRSLRIPRLEGLNLTIRQLIQLQRQRLRSKNPVERFASALLIPNELTRRLRWLNNREIGHLLDDEVGARLNVFAPESTICLAAADRLRGRLIFPSGRMRFRTRRREFPSWTMTCNEGEYVMHAEAALYRAGIPFLPLPFQQDRFASSTFMVRNVAAARLCLHRAGFRVNLRFPATLTDCQTGQTICLYEDRIVL
jgi:hypothetical protein